MLALVWAWIATRCAQRLVWPLRLALGCLFAWLFVWLSPQVYYTYYRAIIDGLPNQVVIKSPPPASDMIALLSFTGSQTLSSHGQGIMGWIVIFCCLWFYKRARRDAAN